MKQLDYLLADKYWEEIIDNKKLVAALVSLKYSRPSKIQRLTIPTLSNKKKLIMTVQAQNGSGKTLSFLIPALLKVNSNKKPITDKGGLAPQVIIVEQQREVATQVQEICQEIAKVFDDKILVSSFSSDVDQGHIMITTPLKYQDFLKKRDHTLKELVLLIVDEVDQVLSNAICAGIVKQLYTRSKENIDCNIAFVSATYTEYAKKFIDEVIKGKTRIDIKPDKIQDLNLKNVQQFYYKGKDKCAILDDILSEIRAEFQIIVFENTRKKTREYYEFLKSKGVDVGFVSGGKDMKPDERQKVVDNFRNKKYKILFTTNLLARGFDQRTIGLVINAGIPTDYENRDKVDFETYLHRIGRTGRFGDLGVALNLIYDDREEKLLDQIREKYGAKITELKESDISKLDDILKDAQKGTELIRQKIQESVETKYPSSQVKS